jgi:hypothetical protein
MARAAWMLALCAVTLSMSRSAVARGADAPEPLWLVVGAADPAPAGIARKAKLLAGVAPGGGLIVRLSDCVGERKPVFLWATTVATSAKEAQAAVADVRDRIKKAVVKRCAAQPGSLLALRVPAVDGSMADAPKPSPTWPVADRSASVWRLAGGRAVVIAHYYVHQAEDPLHGRRERVRLLASKEQKKTLTDDCPSATGLVLGRDATQLAFQCSREVAGGDRFHTTLAFDAEGNRLAQVDHCRRPRFVDDVLICDEETVDRDGVMNLHPKGVPPAK